MPLGDCTKDSRPQTIERTGVCRDSEGEKGSFYSEDPSHLLATDSLSYGDFRPEEPAFMSGRQWKCSFSNYFFSITGSNLQ